MAKVLTIPALPNPKRLKKPRVPDERYVEGQRMLVAAMKYLVQKDADDNKEAVAFLSEHFRSNFRMSDRPIPFPANPQ